MTLREQIEAYQPYNEQEEIDKIQLLKWIDTGLDLYTRENGLAHFSASCWIVNQDYSKVLLAYHKIYESYTWLGGHADGEKDLLQVAIKEAKEESSLENIKVLQDDIFSIEILTVDGHVKNGKYVSSHLHLNVTYLFQANDQDFIQAKLDENTNVKWFAIEDINRYTSEPWFQIHVYQKLVQQVKEKYDK